jgi:hypothetical protein
MILSTQHQVSCNVDANVIAMSALHVRWLGARRFCRALVANCFEAGKWVDSRHTHRLADKKRMIRIMANSDHMHHHPRMHVLTVPCQVGVRTSASGH